MRTPLLAAAFALALVGCDAAAPSAVADAGSRGLTCAAPTLHSIAAGGSNNVLISYTPGATNGSHYIAHVEVRAVGTSTWQDAESTSNGSTITAWQLEKPASGGTAYQVRARQGCSNGGAPDGGFQSATSPYSNTIVDHLIYYPPGSFPGGGA